MMMGKSQIYAFFVFSFLIDLCGTSSPTTLCCYGNICNLIGGSFCDGRLYNNLSATRIE